MPTSAGVESVIERVIDPKVNVKQDASEFPPSLLAEYAKAPQYVELTVEVNGDMLNVCVPEDK